MSLYVYFEIEKRKLIIDLYYAMTWLASIYFYGLLYSQNIKRIYFPFGMAYNRSSSEFIKQIVNPLIFASNLLFQVIVSKFPYDFKE